MFLVDVGLDRDLPFLKPNAEIVRFLEFALEFLQLLLESVEIVLKDALYLLDCFLGFIFDNLIDLATWLRLSFDGVMYL